MVRAPAPLSTDEFKPRKNRYGLHETNCSAGVGRKRGDLVCYRREFFVIVDSVAKT